MTAHVDPHCASGLALRGPVDWEALEMREGSRAWLDPGLEFVYVPDEMHGATLLCTSKVGVEQGAEVSVNIPMPSVVYLLLDQFADGGWAEELPAQGWEHLGQCGPAWTGSCRMMMLRSTLHLPSQVVLPRTATIRTAFACAVQPLVNVAHAPLRAQLARLETEQCKGVRGLEPAIASVRQRLPPYTQRPYTPEQDTPLIVLAGEARSSPFSSCPNTARSTHTDTKYLRAPDSGRPRSNSSSSQGSAGQLLHPPRGGPRGDVDATALGRKSMKVVLEGCLGRGVTEDEFDCVFSEMDSDGSGDVNLQEFAEWVAKKFQDPDRALTSPTHSRSGRMQHSPHLLSSQPPSIPPLCDSAPATPYSAAADASPCNMSCCVRALVPRMGSGDWVGGSVPLHSTPVPFSPTGESWQAGSSPASSASVESEGGPMSPAAASVRQQPAPASDKKQQQQQQQQRTTPAQFRNRPCPHNEWDSVRTKQGVALLRCRVCSCPWRTVLSNRNGPALWHRCSAFDRGECTLGPACPALHVHRSKKRPSVSAAAGAEQPPGVAAS
eukprot:TRINITY_DN12858_c0_g1_i1.p1 TRINITY_DN12858_c0_g1~~TRINITY_DN12858_c0_g1_i1.p1  ORF type:complete len:551 (+),score=130.19 TRINITY_DN12858_c0_g1_i1:101-1753(+)